MISYEEVDRYTWMSALEGSPGGPPSDEAWPAPMKQTNMCIYIYIYVSLCLSLSLYIYIYIYVCVSLSLSVYIYIYIYIYIYAYNKHILQAIVNVCFDAEIKNPQYFSSSRYIYIYTYLYTFYFNVELILCTISQALVWLSTNTCQQIQTNNYNAEPQIPQNLASSPARLGRRRAPRLARAEARFRCRPARPAAAG